MNVGFINVPKRTFLGDPGSFMVSLLQPGRFTTRRVVRQFAVSSLLSLLTATHNPHRIFAMVAIFVYDAGSRRTSRTLGDTPGTQMAWTYGRQDNSPTAINSGIPGASFTYTTGRRSAGINMTPSGGESRRLFPTMKHRQPRSSARTVSVGQRKRSMRRTRKRTSRALSKYESTV